MKVMYGKNMNGGTFVWLDHQIAETPNMVEDHYPVAWIEPQGTEILRFSLETYSSLLGDLYKLTNFEKDLIKEDNGGTEGLRQKLLDFREKKVAEFE